MSFERSICLALWLVLLFAGVSLDASSDGSKSLSPVSRKIDFAVDIKPILDNSCLGCHGPEKQSGGYRVDVKGIALKGGDYHENVIVPGKSDDSVMIHFVSGQVKDMLMPKKGDPLSAEQIGLLRAWIDQGAEWPAALAGDTKIDLWSYKPPIRPIVPNTKFRSKVLNPIDAFVFARLEKENLSPSPEAERRTLIRRLYFDLIGLPPKPEEVEAFLSDRSSDAHAKLVERLLASPHYGERWARHWLDVVRFAESHGFEMNKPRSNAWPFRDYIIESFNADKPYNEFIIEQLAGDAVGSDVATGFIVGGATDQVTSPDPALTAQQRQDELHDMVSTTASAFLGLTVGCARCHNHKFDPISQVDYFAMQAVFSGVKHGERELNLPYQEDLKREAKNIRDSLGEIESQLEPFEEVATIGNTGGKHSQWRVPVHPRINAERFAPVDAKFIRFTVLATAGDDAPCIDELEVYSAGEIPCNVALEKAGASATASGTYPGSAIHKLEHINNGLYGNSQSWISNEKGAGWVQIELPQTVLINRVVWGRDREEKYADRIATQYKIEVATDTNQWLLVASSEDRRPLVAGAKPESPYSSEGMPEKASAELKVLLARKEKFELRLAELANFPKVYTGKFERPEPTYRLHRGEPLQKREPVAPGAISAIQPALNLSHETPEQERRLSLANWIANDTNPLTARVMVNRIWQYHFGEGIVSTSSDFGMNGMRPIHPELLDWLAIEFMSQGWSVKAIHRLIVNSAVYRQSSAPNSKGTAADSGALLLWRFPARRLEAEPIRDSVLSVSGKLDLKMGGPGYDVFEPNNNYVRIYEPKKEFGPAEWRRMIYQFKPRMQQDGTFGAFDCPDGGQIAPRRTSSTTPLQALNLLNSPFMLQQAEFFAERVKAEAGNDLRKQTRRAFELAFNRLPNSKELKGAVQLIEREGLAIFCRALLNANEFVYVF